MRLITEEKKGADGGEGGLWRMGRPAGHLLIEAIFNVY